MKAIFETKSNYKNVNGKALEIVEISGTRISCLTPAFGFSECTGNPEGNIDIVSDFCISELVSFENNTYKVLKKNIKTYNLK